MILFSLFALPVLFPALAAGELGSSGSELLSAPFAGRARVVIAQDLQAVPSFNPRSEKIAALLDLGLLHLTGQPNPAAAWHSLLSTQDIIGLKVFSAPGATGGTRPAVVECIIQSLLAAGFASRQIIIWDKRAADLRRAGFLDLAQKYGTQMAGSADEGYDENVFYERALLGKRVWGDYEFDRSGDGVGRKSYVSKLVTRKMTKIVNVSPLLNHNLAGVSGNLYGLVFGSVDNTIRFDSNSTHFPVAIPEIYALPELGDRVVLNIVDALICQYQGEDRTHLHYSTMLGQLRFSTDPVALDVLSIQELNRQRELAKIPGQMTNFQIYINAALIEIGLSDPTKIDVLTVP